MGKATLQEQREFISAFYGDGYCDCGGKDESTLEEINEAIADCECMLHEAIDRKDRKEISYWRKLLQENKVCRRKLLTA